MPNGVKDAPVGREDVIASLLRTAGANRLPHQHGQTLLDHLLRTRKIVERWLQPVWVQDAAALHTVYGTSVYRSQLIAVSNREQVRAAAGDKAERLAYLFGAVDRRELFAWFASIGRDPEAPPSFRVRFSQEGRREILARQEAGHLLVLHMANLAEQVAGAEGLPGRWLAQVSQWGSMLVRAGLPAPPCFGGCRSAVRAEDEQKALKAYLAGSSPTSSGPCDSAGHFDIALESCPWVGEPWVWKAWLAAMQEREADARLFASEARRRLLELGTCWDKRLSFDQWLSLADMLEQCGQLGLGRDLPSLNTHQPGLSLASLSDFMTAGAHDPAPASAPSAGEAHLQRFADYMKTFSNEPDRRTARHYPGLASRPWHDPRRFEIVDRLEANYPAIRREISQVERPAFQPENESIPRSGSWDVLMLFEHGRKNEEACQQCPFTTALIMDNPAPVTPEGLIYFSRMAPGTHVAAHCGPTNIRLRCHLGLQVPAGDCGIRVGREVRAWDEGRCLVFDDHYEHEAWNRTAQDRVVLIVDIWNPELSDREIALLWALDNYALSHARRMARRAGATPRLRRDNTPEPRS